jgi:hypothetical protein
MCYVYSVWNACLRAYARERDERWRSWCMVRAKTRRPGRVRGEGKREKGKQDMFETRPRTGPIESGTLLGPFLVQTVIPCKTQHTNESGYVSSTLIFRSLHTCFTVYSSIGVFHC